MKPTLSDFFNEDPEKKEFLAKFSRAEILNQAKDTLMRALIAKGEEKLEMDGVDLEGGMEV